MTTSRRDILNSGKYGAFGLMLGALHPAIAKAVSISANVKTGTIKDVEHVVILTQENRSFDHYFGTMSGVRGFGDRFPIPVADTGYRHKNTVFVQPNENNSAPHLIAPFKLNTKQNFEHMRHQGTPHTFPDAQDAWDNGRLGNWPDAKHNHSMGYFTREDIPFQFALAEAFTICDANHCSMHAGTNPNRLYIWTGTINPDGTKNGPVLNNGYDELNADPKNHGGYDWKTYPERLDEANISWQIYQNMRDNFTDNPIVGFKKFRAANIANDAASQALAAKSMRTRDLDLLLEDVKNDKLPQVSWIVATAAGSEHPSSSTPAQGAQYTAKVLEALTANPDVWAKTVFLINFDENDGLFDHMPPPAPPSVGENGDKFGASTIDTIDEYHIIGTDKYINQPYGLGPRVPLYVISPWSRGGFVSSEVFDHTSIIRFLEARFGVMEPNISPWRRAVCGDLTSCFDFETPNQTPFYGQLPKTDELAERVKTILLHSTPRPPLTMVAPAQEIGARLKRPTPYYILALANLRGNEIVIHMSNNGYVGAIVLQVYDRHNLGALPYRFTIGAGQTIEWKWPIGANGYDLWLLGPNGFHRHFTGAADAKPISGEIILNDKDSFLSLENHNAANKLVTIDDLCYGARRIQINLLPNEKRLIPLNFKPSHNWYDLSIASHGEKTRIAGYIETGKIGINDPGFAASALLNQV